MKVSKHCALVAIRYSRHLSRFFSALGIENNSACGIGDAAHAAREFAGEVVICEYEFLATISK